MSELQEGEGPVAQRLVRDWGERLARKKFPEGMDISPMRCLDFMFSPALCCVLLVLTPLPSWDLQTRRKVPARTALCQGMKGSWGTSNKGRCRLVCTTLPVHWNIFYVPVGVLGQSNIKDCGPSILRQHQKMWSLEGTICVGTGPRFVWMNSEGGAFVRAGLNQVSISSSGRCCGVSPTSPAARALAVPIP